MANARDFALTADTIAEAARLGSATIHEAAGRIGALPAAIRPVDPTWRIAGPARTVDCLTGDNLAIHHAIYAATPGEILVVRTGDAEPIWGYWGEIMSWAAHSRRLGGLVLQGGSRDHALLPTVGFPVFSLGSCIRGTIKNAPHPTSAVDAAIRIGEIDINSGDLVIGDLDGVAIVPAAAAIEVITQGQLREAKEADVIARLQAGATTLDLFDLR